MTPATQVKLLRVLQERKFRRLGGRTEQEVDVRVLAATNIDPATAIREGRLREDLYYRLNVFTISLPPLRERKDDLALLIQAFIDEFNARDNRAVQARVAGGDAAAGALRLAGQRARAAQRDRARHHPRARRLDRADAPAGVRCAAGRGGGGAGQRPDDRARHDRRRGRAEADHGDARFRRRQQDARRRDARHQLEDAAQQAESLQGRGCQGTVRHACTVRTVHRRDAPFPEAEAGAGRHR